MSVLSILILTLLISHLQAGTFTASGTNPIDVSVANKGETADYTFTFIPDTTIPVGGQLYVVFPTQYSFGLGIVNDPVCSVSCAISAYTVIFTFTDPALSSVVSTVKVESVVNPTTRGGTGNFQLISKTEDNILDQNLVFGVIGIADTIGYLTSTVVSLDSSGVLNAGEATKYDFSFKVGQIIPANSYMKFTILDENFGLSTYPSCSPYSVNGKSISGKISCQTIDREIYVRGLSADIPSGQTVGIAVSMTNPAFSGTTAGFEIAIFRNNTNAIYVRKTGISGIPITAGKLSDIALTQVISTALPSRQKTMDYRITFLPKNPLALNSMIVLTFPSTFILDSTASQYNYIVSGLDDISETTQAAIVVANNSVYLNNYQAITNPALITLQVRLQNPDNIGVTSPIYIQTYTDSSLTTVIDADTTTAYTTIKNLPSPTSHSIVTPATSAAPTSYAIATLEFSFKPSVSLLGSYYIQILVPSGFTVQNVQTSSCQIFSTNIGTVYVTSNYCYNIDNLIIIQLRSTDSMPLGTTASFQLLNVLTTPTTNGTYLFDITTYKSDGTTALESWSEGFTTTSVTFPSSAVNTLCQAIGYTTILTLTFTVGLDVPAGITQTSALDTKGIIELAFTGITLATLGGDGVNIISIPCRANSGLSAITGNIECYIMPYSTPTIVLENFKAISANTIASVSFPKITNPAASFTAVLKTVSLYNRIRTELNSATLTIPVAAAIAPTESGSVTSSAYSYTSNIVSTYSNITFNPGTSTVISGPGTFIFEMPFYDIGWIPASNTIACKLGTIYYPCTRYDGVDWITVDLPSGSTLPTSTTITLENLRVPRYSWTPIGGIKMRFITSSDKQETVNRPQSYFTPASTPAFYLSSLIADTKSKGAVNAQYTLSFTSSNEIPEGASIVVYFPLEYSLLSSYPPVVFSSPNLVDIDSSTTVTFTPDVQTLTVTNFQTIPALTSFDIVVQGLRNPSSVAGSTGWVARVYLNGYIMVEDTNFDTFTFTPTLSSGTITFNSIVANPSNVEETASYTIDFTPATAIPAGGLVTIEFPSTWYSGLTSPPACSVAGGITTFSTCTLSGTTYTITLDSGYSTGGIQVTIDNIVNPSSTGTTDGFVIETYYDSSFLDTTDSTDTTSRTVTLVAEPDDLTIQSLTFDPQNEGEPATYTFTFLPTNSLTSDMEIQFKFPAVYDPLLGLTVSCETISGLTGDVSCAIADNIITATGFDDYTPDADSPICIQVHGVINPNQNIITNTGQFRVSTLLTNTYVFIDSNDNAGAFQPLAAPDWSTLYNITGTNYNSRIKANYTYNFTNSIALPSTTDQGAILIDFPSDFSLTSGSMTCYSNTTAFAGTNDLSCTVANNRITITNQSSAYTGNLVFMTALITNPVNEGTAGNIVVKTYDGFNAKILQRSYKNLDPFEFSYTFPGPQITVNGGNSIRVEKGTETNAIYMTLDYPCALNLEFVPTTPGFTVVPFTVDMNLGDIKSSFRVAVAQSFPQGTYYITWETLNDLSTPYYTPLSKTEVIITNPTTITIGIPTVFNIPYGGNSLPSSFTVDYGPYVGIEVILSFASTYPGITIDPSIVIFKAGVTSSSFTIYSSNDTSVTGGTIVSKGSINLELSGVNSAVYALGDTSLDFQVISADNVAPDITELTVTDITQTTVNIVIGTSEICVAYYMIALDGTAKPTQEEVVNGGPATYSTTKSTYGSVIIGTENTATVAITGLVAETPYIVYVYLVDRGGNSNSPSSESFETSDRYNAATFSLRFGQSFLNSAEITTIITEVAFVLSLPPAKVQERVYVVTVASSRLLEEEYDSESTTRTLPGSTNSTSSEVAVAGEDSEDSRDLASSSIIIYLQIITTPESSVYMSPVAMANLLNSKTTQLNNLLTNFDTTYTIAGTEFTRYYPGFPTQPYSPSLDVYWVAVEGTLNNYGVIFATFVKAAEDYGKPSPYQIANGLDSLNRAMPTGSVEVSTAYKNFTINVTTLDANTDYNVYVIGGSAHPGYPDLPESTAIVILTVKTNPAPTTPHLNINGASILEVKYVMMMVITLFLVLLK